MKKLLLLISLLILPVSTYAVMGTLTPAANPQQSVYVLSQSGIPFIKASSGTMGNNCAISGLTALPRTMSGGAYIYLPAGAIAAGVPASADWYWFVGSSTTAGTCYNQTYANNKDAVGTPRVPPANTAFSTTGPGAFTGVTGAVTGVSLTLPGGSMGINGRLKLSTSWALTSSAGTKVTSMTFGGSSVDASGTQTTTTSVVWDGHVYNRGVTNIQGFGYSRDTSATIQPFGSVTVADGAVDTSSAVTIAVSMNNNTATDSINLEGYQVLVYPSN